MEELKQQFGPDQFSIRHSDRTEYSPVGISSIVGNGAATTINTAFGNIIVTRAGENGY